MILNSVGNFIPLFYDIPLFVLLVVSVYTDLAYKKIYNWITFPMIILGFVLHALVGGWPELADSLLGFFMGVAIFSLAYFWGGIGGGDVKLVAAIGSLGGYIFVMWSIFYSALIGGFIAILILIWKENLFFGLKQTAFLLVNAFSGKRKRLEILSQSSREIPYGFAIVVGTFCVLAGKYLSLRL